MSYITAMIMGYREKTKNIVKRDCLSVADSLFLIRQTTAGLFSRISLDDIFNLVDQVAGRSGFFLFSPGFAG